MVKRVGLSWGLRAASRLMRTTIARHRLPPRRPSRSTSHLRYPFADIETSVDATDATPTYAIDHFSRRRPTEIRMRCRKDSLEHEAYRIGWICSLEVEHTAAGETLDEERDRLTQNPADHNVYKLGSINNHNVVIILLPTTGNKTAATVIAQMRMAFPSLQYGLLVGIGGGVPIRTENGSLRLGHVVVGTPVGIHSGVVQYDHGKANKRPFERSGSISPPPAVPSQCCTSFGCPARKT